MFNTNVPSLSDIAAVTGDRDNRGMGMADGGGWWVLIILLAMFGGFGNGGFGGRNGAAVAETDAALQRGFDNQGVMNKLNGIEQGICSLGYDQLAQMNGINSNITQASFGLQQSINAMGVANMQDTNALSRQLSDCCCENRAGIQDLRYTMATDTCAITTAIGQQTQAIMQNDNANYRALHDELVAIQMNAKDEKIADQASMIQALNLAASQANQNQFLIDQLRPCPVPAYSACGPYANGYFGGEGFGNRCGSCC